MELKLFREHFARIPRPVAVLGLHQNNEIHGVTISSLQSVNVNDQRQVLTFVLKKSSHFSHLLIESRKLTINFLANNQDEISKTYSDNDRVPCNDFDGADWSRSESNHVSIKGAAFSIGATLLNTIELEESNIFFVSAEHLIECNEIGTLLYCERSYGVFQHRNNQ